MSLEQVNFEEIRSEILENISNEGEIDITNCSDDQREAEIFHRYQLRMFKSCADNITAYKKQIKGGIFQEDKDILIKIAEYAGKQTARFSLEAKY